VKALLLRGDGGKCSGHELLMKSSAEWNCASKLPTMLTMTLSTRTQITTPTLRTTVVGSGLFNGYSSKWQA